MKKEGSKYQIGPGIMRINLLRFTGRSIQPPIVTILVGTRLTVTTPSSIPDGPKNRFSQLHRLYEDGPSPAILHT